MKLNSSAFEYLSPSNSAHPGSADTDAASRQSPDAHKRPVIAIGLDAAEISLIERWMAEGHLPNFSQLKTQGGCGYLESTVDYADEEALFSCTEPLWVMFSTGCLPLKTGFWDTVQYDPTDYRISCDKITGGYDYKEYPPFYALGENYRVATFDIPVSALSTQVEGLQILGWGGHFPFTPSHSSPSPLLPELISRYGKNPVLHNDHGAWWSAKYHAWLETAIEESIDRRVDICLDLIAREEWDLFVTVFGDIHSAGHEFYHRSQSDHPLYAHCQKNNQKYDQKLGELDPLLKVYQKVDWAIGKILAAAPPEAYVLCFALHGMAANHQDMLSMMFLGEVLYRFNFPGKVGFGSRDLSATPPPLITSPLRRSWVGELWSQVYDKNIFKRLASTWLPAAFQGFAKGDLACPYNSNDNLSFIPALWYRDCWPQMKAFAIPAFSDGHIRINLKGRDANGIVLPEEYDSLCEEITQMLYGLTHGRTGKPLVKSVVRTRKGPIGDGNLNESLGDLSKCDMSKGDMSRDDDSKLIAADLVVIWHETVTDVVDHAELGRIGPVTLFRPGGHRPRGFVMVKGPGIEANSDLPTGAAVDLAPTLLTLMGADLPAYLDGQSLLETSAVSAAK